MTAEIMKFPKRPKAFAFDRAFKARLRAIFNRAYCDGVDFDDFVSAYSELLADVVTEELAFQEQGKQKRENRDGEEIR